jgi:hypothetical protein
MSTAKWSAFGTESANIAGTALNSKATGTTTLIGDIDNSSDLDLYASFWLELGSITPSTGGSVTLQLRRKRGSAYADDACEQNIQDLSSGASAKNVEFLMRLPGPGVYGLYWVNNSGVTSAASGNALYYSRFNEAAN